jgi:hypothetical protein
MTTRYITLDHIEKACKWAKRNMNAKGPTKIDGVKRDFDMTEWDCGTSCCLAGAAAIEAGFSSHPYKTHSPYRSEFETIAGIAGNLFSHNMQYVITDFYKTDHADEDEDFYDSLEDYLTDMQNAFHRHLSLDDHEIPDFVLQVIKNIRKLCKEHKKKLPKFKVTATKKMLAQGQ